MCYPLPRIISFISLNLSLHLKSNPLLRLGSKLVFAIYWLFRWTSNRTYRLAQTPSYKSALYVPLEFLSKNRDIFKILPNLTKVAPIHTPPYMFYTQSCFNTPPTKKKRREFEIDKQAKYRAQLTSTQTWIWLGQFTKLCRVYKTWTIFLVNFLTPQF